MVSSAVPFKEGWIVFEATNKFALPTHPISNELEEARTYALFSDVVQYITTHCQSTKVWVCTHVELHTPLQCRRQWTSRSKSNALWKTRCDQERLRRLTESQLSSSNECQGAWSPPAARWTEMDNLSIHLQAILWPLKKVVHLWIILNTWLGENKWLFFPYLL